MEKIDKKLISGVLVTLVVAGSLGFYGGTVYAKNKNVLPGQTAFGQRQFAGSPNGAQGGMRRGVQNGSAFINGDILNKDDKSITVKLRDGGSKIVFYSDKTTIGKTTDGTIADLEVGKSVMVSASANPDGSATAQNIQIRPAIPTVPQPSQ